MTVAQRQRVVCPRCASPVTGDFKYCPACAFRLKAGAADPIETTPRGTSVSTWLLGLAMATVLGALVAVGAFLFRDQTDASQGLTSTLLAKRSAADLTLATLPEHMVDVPEGPADWVEIEKDGKVEAVLVYARDLKVMAFEVTRRLYDEYLKSTSERVRAGASPGEALERIWHPTTDSDRAYARDYLREWVDAYLAHASDHGMTREEAFEPLLAHVPEELRTPPVVLPRDADQPVPTLTPREFAAAVPFPWGDDLGLLTLAPPAWAYVSRLGVLTWQLPEGTGQLPVTGIAWTDANAFALWARAELGGGLRLRLPIEGEWLRVAHGGHPPVLERDKGRLWPWGNEPLLHACNNAQLWPDGAEPRLQEVDRRYFDEDAIGQLVGDETSDGVYAMGGNAREWTLTDQPPATAGGRLVVHWDPKADDRGLAATRGGSYLRVIHECTVTSRVEEPKAARRDDVGFRLVADKPL